MPPCHIATSPSSPPLVFDAAHLHNSPQQQWHNDRCTGQRQVEGKCEPYQEGPGHTRWREVGVQHMFAFSFLSELPKISSPSPNSAPALKSSSHTHFRGWNLSESLSDHHQPRKQAWLLVFGVSTFLWLPTALKRVVVLVSGLQLLSGHHQLLKRAWLIVFGVSTPLSGHHQPQKRAWLLIFRVVTFLWPPPAPKMSMAACLQGCDLSLANTSPENEHDCLFSGFLPFSDSHKPRKRALTAHFRGFNF